MEYINKVWEWIKNNMILAVIGLFAVVLIFFPKIFRVAKRRRIRRAYRPAQPVRRRRTRRAYTTGGKTKKPWQIKGSLAAKRYMARIRKKR